MVYSNTLEKAAQERTLLEAVNTSLELCPGEEGLCARAAKISKLDHKIAGPILYNVPPRLQLITYSITYFLTCAGCRVMIMIHTTGAGTHGITSQNPENQRIRPGL